MSYIAGLNVTETRTSAEGPAHALGTVGQNSDGKKYKYVEYTAGAVAAVAGNVAGYVSESDTAVTADVSTTDRVGAGVLQAAIPDGGYGWVQISGAATITTALTAGADGNALTLVGAGDSTLDVSAAATDHVCAVAIDASAKRIKCMFPE